MPIRKRRPRRPRKHPSDLARHSVECRMTDAEYYYIKDYCQNNNVSFSKLFVEAAKEKIRNEP